jgi:hypothetical protein
MVARHDMALMSKVRGTHPTLAPAKNIKSAGRGLQPRFQVPDGVCNPVRNVFSLFREKRYGAGCKPAPAKNIKKYS